MPYLKLRTNVKIDPTQSQTVMKQLSNLIAQQTGKPENYVMIDLDSNRTMFFGGNSDPLAYLECKSLGLSSSQVKELSPALCQYLNAELAIPKERIYIEFSDHPRDFWGWNGGTFG
jgi:phenylpyruvate tautomerase